MPKTSMGSKKSMSSKKRSSYFSGQTLCHKQVRDPNLNDLHEKGTNTFVGPSIVPKTSMGSKKSMSSKKRGTHTFFRAKHCTKNKYGIQKKVWVPEKNTHTFSGHTLVPKKQKVLGQKKVWVPKKRNSYFLWAKHGAKKSVGSQKRSMSRKEELILFSGQTLCQKNTK